ncbi:hypothetical protein AMJ39_06900 [candidate division TA06 bacterium DG_24]|uniref:Uncharacterized protein n=3 Tax=Bacteria division TA06 TaxID=1156500 RepID=A0A0S8J837_UNCT6|nr:MAG: hypothetical protein AMJ39_06900 [candidate division TA06 bacterium DG_24]KPK68514.1 MAG: hypothetical protein AMJ82_08010 [candidate division TA06 bacterium SM23_40]KPL05802.1 MAG: hypothetical protein AMJ71_10885 [candidate division TA06 bacterium SM1_40]
MAKKKRITKKELKQDKFALAAVETMDYARQHLPYLIGGLIVVVVLVVGAVGFMRSSAEARTRAETALALANLSYMQGNLESAIAQYDEILRKWGRTKQARHARYYRASANTLLGNYAAAIEDYREFVESSGRDELLAPAALRGIAVCWGDQGLYREAARAYEEVADKHPASIYAASSLLAAGRSYAMAGLDDEAARIYQRVIDEYPESAESQEAEGRVAYIEGRHIPKLSP